MSNVPFTIKADLDLGGRISPYQVDQNPDVTIREGNVPKTLGPGAEVMPACEFTTSEFLLHIPNGLSFLVQGGEEIVYARREDVTNREVLLFLLGSAWGALAYQRRLLPLHASGVIHDGDVYAFTGNSGAGKSTLSAALSHRGHPFFADDVLIVDPTSFETGAICYAGQKDLKLWKDAFSLTGAHQKSMVRDDESFEKFYADPQAYSDASKGHLKELYLLTSQNARHDKTPFEISPITGAISVKQLFAAVYRRGFAERIVGRATLFKWLADLIQHVDVYRFDRPVLKESFAEGADFMSAKIREKLKFPA